MAGSSIKVQQPRPYDLVADSIHVAGVAAGLDGQICARVRDSQGAIVAQGMIKAGGAGHWATFHAELPLAAEPRSAHGTLEVFELASDERREANKVVVPIMIGRSLAEMYRGFAQHTVKQHETLASIAQRYYGAPSLWPRIVQANRHQINQADYLRPGQVLRIPH